MADDISTKHRFLLTIRYSGYDIFTQVVSENNSLIEKVFLKYKKGKAVKGEGISTPKDLPKPTAMFRFLFQFQINIYFGNTKFLFSSC